MYRMYMYVVFTMHMYVVLTVNRIFGIYYT